MTKTNTAAGLIISRKEMIEHLNEDLVRRISSHHRLHGLTARCSRARLDDVDIARELKPTRARELQHAIKIAKQIDYLGGMPCVTPKPVKTSNDPVVMLRAPIWKANAPR